MYIYIYICKQRSCLTIYLFQVVRASDVIKPSPDNPVDDGETLKLHLPVNSFKLTEKETKVPVAADQSCQVFCTAIKPMWARGQADGTKTMECSNGWGRFNKVQENDLVIITIVGEPGNPVVAVGEALAPPTVNVSDPEILRPMVLPERFDDLKVYLSGGKRKLFDFIRMKRVFDARSLNLKANELISNIGASKLRQAWQQRFEPCSSNSRRALATSTSRNSPLQATAQRPPPQQRRPTRHQPPALATSTSRYRRPRGRGTQPRFRAVPPRLLVHAPKATGRSVAGRSVSLTKAEQVQRKTCQCRCACHGTLFSASCG